MDPMSWIDSIFGGQGNSSSGGYEQDGVTIDKGIQPVLSWAIGQYFANAGPIGQYLGAIYGSPGTGIPDHAWASQQDQRSQHSSRRSLRTSASSASWDAADDAPSARQSAVDDMDGQRLRAPASQREPFPQHGASAARGDEVRVFGQPREISSGRPPSAGGGEIQLYIEPSAPILLRPRPKQPVATPPKQADDISTVTVTDPRPERERTDSFRPYFDIDIAPNAVIGMGVNPHRRVHASDVGVPQDFLKWGAWDIDPIQSPASTPRHELASAAGHYRQPVAPPRSFWKRGGTGLVAGGITAATGIAVLFWWNPVGWVAGASVALAIAGGLATGAGSAAQLGMSYDGQTTAEQDQELTRATSAPLGVTSIGGLAGGVFGTVYSGDPREGFEDGAFWGGLAEGIGNLAITLPGALRAIPGIWASAMPWAKSLLLSPMFFLTSAEGFGGNGFRAARLLTRARQLPRIRSVEYLGTTPLVERDADWARFQVFATRSRQEAIFRITKANGEQQIVLADRHLPRGKTTYEAKLGDMGHMFVPHHEARVMNQAYTYMAIATEIGGDVGYLVSTERGAIRLTQRFSREFPEAMSSGQLWVDWVNWRP